MINYFGMPAGLLAHDEGTPGFAMPALSGEKVEFDPSKEGPPVVEEVIPEGLPGSVLEIKQLHEIHDPFKNQWTIRPAPPAFDDG